MALVPEAWIQKIPFFVRKHATTKTIERIASEYPELYAVAERRENCPRRRERRFAASSRASLRREGRSIRYGEGKHDPLQDRAEGGALPEAERGASRHHHGHL